MFIYIYIVKKAFMVSDHMYIESERHKQWDRTNMTTQTIE